MKRKKLYLRKCVKLIKRKKISEWRYAQFFLSVHNLSFTAFFFFLCKNVKTEKRKTNGEKKHKYGLKLKFDKTHYKTGI